MPVKMFKFIFNNLFLVAAWLLVNCSHKEQDIKPNISNEVVTRVQLQLTNQANATDIQTAVWELPLDAALKPLDPDVNKAKILLKKNSAYSSKITMLDDTQSPPFDATEEVEERSNIHLFFYQPLPTSDPLIIPFSSGEVYPDPIPTPVPSGAPLALGITATDHDTNTPSYPVGIETKFVTGSASIGWIRVVLRHQPGGKDGTFAPGSTDLDVGFAVTIQ